MLDGEEYDLYATFDDPEKAIENVKEKCPDALTKLRRGSLTLGELSDGNWQRYRDVLAATSDGDNEQSEDVYKRQEDALVSQDGGVICAEVYADAEIIPDTEELQKVIDRLNASLPMFKQISRITLRKEPFEKTSTQKIKRRGA